MSMLRVSVDTGGTFTDVVAVHGDGRVLALKTPSTPADPSASLLTGIREAVAQSGMALTDLDLVAHGTTSATNAVLEHRFEGLGLLVTEGFRHILEIARQSVPDGYGNSFFWVKPPRLVPLHLVREAPGRMDYTGTVLQELDEEQAVEAVQQLVDQGVNRLGVCLLHSYANDAHERRVADLLAARFPKLFVSLSSEVLPEYREYERAMTTLVDVMVKPYVREYLTRAHDELNEEAGTTPLLIMQSNGGVVSAEAAGERPVTMLLSGPAAGVLGAVHVAEQAGLTDILTLDAGGTSTDICLVENLTPLVTTHALIENYPVKTPMLDIATVAAGGGSIARIGEFNSLKVGPRSVGAVPGPICYGNGGTELSVTDAAVTLGWLPAAFIGGGLVLDVEASRAAFVDFGARLGISPEGAAAGVLEIAAANQVHGIRRVTTTKGRDPADYTLVAFGGSGPVLAAISADFLAIKSILVPPFPATSRRTACKCRTCEATTCEHWSDSNQRLIRPRSSSSGKRSKTGGVPICGSRESPRRTGNCAGSLTCATTARRTRSALRSPKARPVRRRCGPCGRTSIPPMSRSADSPMRASRRSNSCSCACRRWAGCTGRRACGSPDQGTSTPWDPAACTGTPRAGSILLSMTGTNCRTEPESQVLR